MDNESNDHINSRDVLIPGTPINSRDAFINSRDALLIFKTMNEVSEWTLYMRHLKVRKWTVNFSKLFLLTIFIYLASCMNWIMENPSFVFREIILRPSSLTDANFIIGLDVQNPNRFDFTLKSFEYILFLDDKEIGTGQLEKEILVHSLSTAQMQVLVAVKLKDLRDILKTIKAGHDLPYRIKGNASIETTFGSRDFPISRDGHTGQMDL
ncbi:MAG TPA: hypothetical protein DDY17_04070 [Syntrophaceae bacterium]|nr:hypothetical protein [Syntrophaceae bacterium]